MFPCALLLALAMPLASTHAEPSKEELQVARTLFGQALAEEKLEHWELALAKLESVQAIKSSPSVLYHIALCEERLGRLAAALSDYEAARVAARNENNREVLAIVDEPIVRLSAEVPHVTLSIDTPPANAKIEIDGRNLSAIGFQVPIPLDPGSHTIVITAPGHAPFQHTLVLQPKADVGVRVIMKPSAAPVAAPALAPPPTGAQKQYPMRPYAVATTAGAIVLAGAGVGLILGAGVVKGGTDAPGEGCMAAGQTSCTGKATAINVMDWSGGGALVGAVGLAAASVVLWTRPGKSPTAQRARTQLAFGVGRIGLEGTFE